MFGFRKQRFHPHFAFAQSFLLSECLLIGTNPLEILLSHITIEATPLGTGRTLPFNWAGIADGSWSTIVLSLHVGKALCQFPVSYMVHIDATNMPVLTSCIAPVKHPTHDASIARGEQVLSLEIDGGGRLEEILKKRSDSTLTFITLSIWRWGSVFKHTIISGESHERINITPIDSLFQLLDDLDRRCCQDVLWHGCFPAQ